jgi:hypothetical protein
MKDEFPLKKAGPRESAAESEHSMPEDVDHAGVLFDDDGLLWKLNQDGSPAEREGADAIRLRRRERAADDQLLDSLITIATSLEIGFVETRMRRLRAALTGNLQRNDAWRDDKSRAASLQRVEELLGYSPDVGALNRLTYGQSLVFDRYWAIYRIHGDVDLEVPGQDDQLFRDDLFSRTL